MALAQKHEQDDHALLEELARLVEGLRMIRYQPIFEKAGNTSALAVEEFADLFSRHLLYEEEILFPVLREPAPPQAGKKLDSLREEHAALRSCAQDLVHRVRQEDLAGACDAGRIFMAALLDHVARETQVTGELLKELDTISAARLRRVLESERESA